MYYLTISNVLLSKGLCENMSIFDAMIAHETCYPLNHTKYCKRNYIPVYKID